MNKVSSEFDLAIFPLVWFTIELSNDQKLGELVIPSVLLKKTIILGIFCLFVHCALFYSKYTLYRLQVLLKFGLCHFFALYLWWTFSYIKIHIAKKHLHTRSHSFRIQPKCLRTSNLTHCYIQVSHWEIYRGEATVQVGSYQSSLVCCFWWVSIREYKIESNRATYRKKWISGEVESSTTADPW